MEKEYRHKIDSYEITTYDEMGDRITYQRVTNPYEITTPWIFGVIPRSIKIRLYRPKETKNTIDIDFNVGEISFYKKHKFMLGEYYLNDNITIKVNIVESNMKNTKTYIIFLRFKRIREMQIEGN